MELGAGRTYVTPVFIPVMHRIIHPAVFFTHSILPLPFLTFLHHPILPLIFFIIIVV